MDPTIGDLFGGATLLVIAAFLIALAILWFVLPFAIFGTKPRLDEQTQYLREIRDELRMLNGLLRRQASESPAVGPPGVAGASSVLPPLTADPSSRP